MPKLIVKQNVSSADRQAQRNKLMSVGGLLFLLVVVAVTAFFLNRPVITSPAQEPLNLDSAANAEAKNSYIALHNVFNELGAEYETLSAQGVDDYEKNLKLLGKSDSILRHLDRMQGTVADLSLSAEEQTQLFNRHQFYKDYWQAKSHFRQLRVSRFEGGAGGDNEISGEAEVSGDMAESATIPATDPPKKFKFATPPPGMELPAGFCDLNNPDSCKPEGANAGVAQANDIPLAEDIPEPLPVVDNAPKKFKFATPPPGMELPVGFCDLNNPDSCKPDSFEDLQAGGEDSLQPLPAPDGQPKKFKFATPPSGMELPAGFCDLNNPGSCKPETAGAEMAAEGNNQTN